MKPVNIYLLSQVKEEQLFSRYENMLSGRKEEKRMKVHEQLSLCLLVDHLLLSGTSLEAMDGFFYSYTIQHISKEFDLLKFSSDCKKILNIELKSVPVKQTDMEKQLLQNQHYLQHLSNNILSYVYVASENLLYTLDMKKGLIPCAFEHLVEDMMSFGDVCRNDIDALFEASDYLISPLNTPEKFLNHNYFLTNQQEDFKNSILCHLKDSDHSPTLIGISGSAGTGKTLLLYDIAKSCAETSRICMVHCGLLSNGHYYLASHIEHMDVLSIADLNEETDFSSYQYIFIDEAQRIYQDRFQIIEAAARLHNISCIYSYDPRQVLSNEEFKLDISSRISSMTHYSYKLSNRIRTNKELASFLTSFFDLKRKIYRYTYESVDILFASRFLESVRFLDFYAKEGYTFFNFTRFTYPQQIFDISHDETAILQVIGLEFERVCILIDGSYTYNEKGVLQATGTSDSDYMALKLLFQAVTRTRDKLCIIVVEDLSFFQQILNIKADCLFD
ncbi:MAG: hypothetical protein ACI4E3_11520 [Candidatus Fimousia sp.]